jgi:hypothetical protein
MEFTKKISKTHSQISDWVGCVVEKFWVSGEFLNADESFFTKATEAINKPQQLVSPNSFCSD